jgi:L-amino acid N-acyltransferase YncA
VKLILKTGIGRALLAKLIDRCEELGIRQMLARIGDSANTGSVGLHAALGFKHVGTMSAVGWKFDRWLDVVVMQRAIGPADSIPPS